MSNGANERLKIYTQHVSLRQNTEEEVRGKELEAVSYSLRGEFLMAFFFSVKVDEIVKVDVCVGVFR